MPGRISRRKLAEYVANGLQTGKENVIQELAAYLIQTKRTREAELVVRDVEMELKNRGVVIADIASAYELTESVRAEITRFIGSQVSAKNPTVTLRESVDETLLGGIRVALPGALFDGTIRHKLTALKRTKQS